LKAEQTFILEGHRAAIYTLIPYQGTYILSCGGDGWIVRWDAYGRQKDGQLIAQVDAKVFSMHLINDYLLALGDMNGHLYWVDLDENKTIKNVKHHQKGIFEILQYKSNLLTLGGDGQLTKWSLDTYYPVESIQINRDGLRCGLIVDDKLIIGGSDNAIHVINLESFTIEKTIPQAHKNSVFSLAYTGDVLLSGGRDALLKEWTFPSLKLHSSREAHWFTINDICYIAEEELIVTASRDKSIRFWDAKSLQPLTTVGLQQGGHMNSVNTILFHKGSGLIFSAGDDRSIRAYRPRW
jgi:WD40 repeat protein